MDAKVSLNRLKRRPRRADGFTVIELMITVVVIAVLASMAGPTFENFITKQRLKGAIEDIRGMIQEAKTEAVVRGDSSFLDIDTSGTWCVGYRMGSACDCTAASGSDLCSLDYMVSSSTVAVTKRISGADYQDVSFKINSGFTAPSSFDPINSVLPIAGTGTLEVSAGIWTANIVVSRLGRARICAETYSEGLGYPVCT
jgi:prepilin-type N-terminal cleavage/methylation domain-containing protein